MRRLGLAALVLAGLVGACGGGGKDAAVCRREAAELSQLLATMDHEPPGFYGSGITLVSRSDVPPTPPPSGIEIHVTREGALYLGEPLDAPGVRDRLERDARRPRGGTERGLLYLVIAEDARWADVAHATAVGWEADLVELALAFARPPVPVTPPPRSRIDDDLERIRDSVEPGQKATELARLLQGVVRGCPALVRAFGSVAGVEGESKADTLMRAIEPALVECNCSLDMRSLSSALFWLLYVDKPTSAFRITLAADGEPIELPPDTPWRDAHARFSPGARVLVKLPQTGP